MQGTLEDVFGTEEPPEALIPVALGPLMFDAAANGMRNFRWRGVELLRGIDYPLRDENWGTLAVRTIREEKTDEGSGFRWMREFETDDRSIRGQLEITASSDGVVAAELALQILADRRLCRTGFTLLHPIKGLAGRPMRLTAPNGEKSAAEFPEAISPRQPALGFVSIAYAIDGASLAIETRGAEFEMEDQRNWSDASFKTYVRTSTFPGPYEVKRGEVFRQRLALTFSGAISTAAHAPPTPRLVVRRTGHAGGEVFPELALACDSAWPAAERPNGLRSLRSLVRLDLSEPAEPAAYPDAPLDIELVVSDDRGELERELNSLAGRLARLGFSPDHVFALPRAYLRSYQPKGPWPRGATPEDAAEAARIAFPNAKIGGGALTYFTEFNRRPPDLSRIDYVTHGSAAIVHAADDLSVFQTLEALPDIFRSVRRLAPGKPYRLGLFSIGMRTNPYGSGLAANLERTRKAMSGDDPRARALVGASWLVGVVAATERAGVELLTLASASGPFAVQSADGFSPGYHALAALARMQGRPRLGLETGDPRLHAAGVELEGGRVLAIVANGSWSPKTLELGFNAEVAALDAHSAPAAKRNPDWTRHAARLLEGRLYLAPYALAIVEAPLPSEPKP